MSHRFAAVVLGLSLLTAAGVVGTATSTSAALDAWEPVVEQLAWSVEELPPVQKPGASAAWVFPPDDRRAVEDTTEWPFRLITHIVLYDEFDDPVGECTGMLISSNAILTAAHCVYDFEAGDWYGGVLFVPGEDRTHFPFGTALGIDASIPVGYVETGQSKYDLAVVKVSGASFSPTGPYTYLASAADSYFYHAATVLFTAGYPGDKPLGTQWFSAAPVEYVDPEFIVTTMDAYPGQSGSPIFTVNFDTDRIHVVGLYSFETPYFNAGVRLTAVNIEALGQYCVRLGCTFATTTLQAGPAPTASPTVTLTPTKTPTPTATATATATATQPPGPPSGGATNRPFKLRAQQLARD